MFLNIANADEGATVKFYEDTLVKAVGYPPYIYINGVITTDTPKKLKQVIEANNLDKAIVVLNSIGGNLFAGMELGEIIRSNGFYTYLGRENASAEKLRLLNGECYSSCVFAFTGGVYRFIEDDDKIGVHRFSSKVDIGNELEAAQVISAVTARYFEKMGVQSGLFERMSLADSLDIDILTKDEALQLNLANNGILPTAWSYESSEDGQVIYLKGNRVGWMGEGKVLLICEPANIPKLVVMYSMGENLISGLLTITVNNNKYQANAEDLGKGYVVSEFNPQKSMLEDMLLNNKSEYVFGTANKDLAYIFEIEKANDEKLITYIKRCLNYYK